MKKSLTLIGNGLFCAMLILGCKGGNESAGDKYLKANDPVNALMRYDLALQKGKTSRDFFVNYTKANILTLQDRAKSDPTAEFLDALNDTIVSLLSQHPNAENEASYSNILFDLGSQRIETGDPEAIESGFKFFNSIESLSNKAPGVSEKIAAMKKIYIDKKLKEITDEQNEATTEPTQGVAAEYHLNELVMATGETPEIKTLWSLVRKTNLSNYLMYDVQGLLVKVDSRINKYAVLLALPKYSATATGIKTQIRAFNGSSGSIRFEGNKITLVDDNGQVYKPTTKSGGFGKDKEIAASAEGPVGVLAFSFPAGTVPSYIQLETSAGLSRKYLP